jgi:group I intron endonuclease
VNNKKYIGQTFQEPLKRFKAHIYSSNRGSNLALHRAIRKYGNDKFKQTILEITNQENLCALEIKYIAELNTFHSPEGYNETLGGESGCLGFKQSEETCKAKSERMKGEKHFFYGATGEEHPSFGTKRNEETKNKLRYIKTEAHKIKLSESHKGKKFPNHHMKSEENKKKYSELHKGKKLTEETKKKISISRIGRFNGQDNPFYGKLHTEETKLKMRNAKRKKRTCINVVSPIDGKIYPSMAEAMRITGVSKYLCSKWEKVV